MASTALLAWRSERADRLDRLQSAHTTVGGSGPGRRWLTEELNHALVLRLAAEFQGFARDLHTVRRWRSTLDGLATGPDRVTREYLRQVFGISAW